VFPKGKLTLAPGDRLELELPGGGGWGDPMQRSRDLVRSDIQQGLVSSQQAGVLYGYQGN
jgi:N-methylhydantoinase B